MNKLTVRTVVVITCSILCALLLMIVHLPSWINAVRPAWVALVIVYWSIALPHRVSVGIAWWVGIVVDLFMGSALGEHALALTCIVYLTAKFYVQIRLFPFWQQVSTVVGLMVIYHAVIYTVELMV